MYSGVITTKPALFAINLPGLELDADLAASADPGVATADGKLYHGRVLDYACDWRLQEHAVVIVAEGTCMVEFAQRIMKFYAHESCGWCIPCREGTTWLKKLLDRFHDGGGRGEDIPLIDQLAKNILGRTFCPLGDAAAMPVMSYIKLFRDGVDTFWYGLLAVVVLAAFAALVREFGGQVNLSAMAGGQARPVKAGTEYR